MSHDPTRHSPGAELGVLLDRTADALTRAAELCPELGASGRWTDSPDLASTALAAAHRLLLARLTIADDPGRLLATVALLTEIDDLRTSLRELEINRRATSVAAVQQALHRLRSADSVDRLVTLAPVELGRLGYRRSLLSRLSGQTWSPRSAFAEDDPDLTEALVRIGRADPGRIGREVPETEVVRTRRSLLVRDAHNHPGVHRQLIDRAGTDDYVAAPLVVGNEVIGIVHADRHAVTGHVTDFDRELLEMFSEGLGCVLERAIMAERLDRYGDVVAEQNRAFARITGDAYDLDPPSDLLQDPTAAGGLMTSLTPREAEVLRLIADGRSNQQVAELLFLSVGTVKTHVKHVLRKLGAASRGEAVARFHAEQQSRG